MAAGWIHLVHDDPVAARRYLQFNPGNEGSERISLWMDGWLARTLFILGEYREAERTVERGLARAERFGIRFLEPIGPARRRYRGDRELACLYVNRSPATTPSSSSASSPCAACHRRHAATSPAEPRR